MQEDGFTDVKTKIYLDMRHEILNEDIKEYVYEDIRDWLNKKIQQLEK
jgi:alpha-beta hydrolase superfamily lysophospholipase